MTNMSEDNDSNLNDKKYIISIAENIHMNMVERYSKLDTAKQGRMTEANLDAVIDAYCEVNKGCNHLSGSADKQRTHLEEEHSNLHLESLINPPLDLHLTGGKNDLSLESEVGGTKAVMHDFNKLLKRPDDDKVMITETKSFKSIGKFTNTVEEASKENTGSFTHTEVYRRKNQKANTSQIFTTTFINGECVYSSSNKESEISKKVK